MTKERDMSLQQAAAEKAREGVAGGESADSGDA